MLDGAILLLTAAFEQFISDLMIAYAENLPTVISAYSDLPATVRAANEGQTGVALSGDGFVSRRFTEFELRQIVTYLYDCQTGVTPYVLNGEALALNDRSLRVGVLQDLFSRLVDQLLSIEG